MHQEKPEWEINLKSMLFAAAYRWKVMLAAAAALAVLLGGFQMVSVWRERNNDDLYAQHKVAYTEYKNKKNVLKKTIEKLEKDIEEQKTYLDESMLMQLDHRDVHQARVNLYLTTPYQIMPDKVFQNTDKAELLLAFYVSSLSDQLLLTDIAKEVNLDAKYLTEIVSIETDLGHILSITVSWTDDAGAQAIMAALVAHTQSYHDVLSETVGEHTLTVVLDTVGSVVDPGVFDRQEQENSQLENYELQLAEKDVELRGLVEPVIGEVSVSGILKTGIKWAVLGGIAGVVLVAALCCFAYVFSDKVYCGTDVQARCGVRVLGSLSSGKRIDPITRHIRRAEGRIVADPNEVPVLLQETLLQYARGAANVLVTGDMKPELVESCTARLQEGLTDVKLTACGSILEDVNAVRGLSQCDAVLLLEKCGSSRYHRISREMAQINDANKPLMGCIIVER